MSDLAIERKGRFLPGPVSTVFLEGFFVDLYEASLHPALLATVVLAELPPALGFDIPESIDLFFPELLRLSTFSKR